MIIFLVSCATHHSSEQVKPNFLIFIADDLTYRDISPYGNTDVITPNLKEFAKTAVKYNHMYVSSAMCAPTRMELYTGLQPVRSGAHPNHSRVYDNVRSLPNYLRPLGYRVASLGKRHEFPMENFSFDHLGGMHHDNGKTKKELDLSLAKTFFESTGQPWTLVVASNQPHTPWNRGDASQYDEAKLNVPEYLEDTSETRAALTRYYAEISYLDRQFGTVLEYLRKSNQKRDTLIIFLSEQGSNFPFAKWTLYDNGHHSAMLTAWHFGKNRASKKQASRETNAIIQYADIVPTLIELAGQSPDKLSLDGKSFVSVLAGSSDKHRDYAFGVHTTRGIYSGAPSYPIRVVTDGRYRLIWNLDHTKQFANSVVKQGGPKHTLSSWLKSENIATRKRAKRYLARPQFELYNLDEDPFELENLALDPAQHFFIRNKLLTQLKNWMAAQRDEGIKTELDAESRKHIGKRSVDLGIPAGGTALDYKW